MQYQYFGSFYEGLAAVRAESGLYGYINRKGKMVIAPRFQNARGFAEGLAPVCIEGQWGFANHEGQVVIEPKYKEVSGFSEGLAVVFFRHTNKLSGERETSCGFIDKNGDFAFQIDNCLSADQFHEGLAAIKRNTGKREFISNSGASALKPTADDVRGFSQGLAYFDKSAFHGFIDHSGKTRAKVAGSVATAFSEGVSISFDENTNSLKFVDIDGRILGVKKNRDYATPFAEGCAVVGLSSAHRPTIKKDPNPLWIREFVDKRGQLTISESFNSAMPFSEGLAAVNFGTGILENDAEVPFLMPKEYPGLRTIFRD